MRVELRDAGSHVPLEGAVIRVRSMSLPVPGTGLRLGRAARPGDAVTDAEGAAVVAAPLTSAAQILVFTRRHGADAIFMDAHPGRDGPTAWIDPRGPEHGDGDEPAFEIRLLPIRTGGG